jgi:hypothetical protein
MLLFGGIRSGESHRLYSQTIVVGRRYPLCKRTNYELPDGILHTNSFRNLSRRLAFSQRFVPRYATDPDSVESESSPRHLSP